MRTFYKYKYFNQGKAGRYYYSATLYYNFSKIIEEKGFLCENSTIRILLVEDTETQRYAIIRQDNNNNREILGHGFDYVLFKKLYNLEIEKFVKMCMPLS